MKTRGLKYSNKTHFRQNLNSYILSLIIPLICILIFTKTVTAQDYCLSFDGVNDYVNVSPIPTFNSTMTIEAWIKIIVPNGYSIPEPNIVSWGADANSVEFRLGFSGSNATLQFGIDATGSGGGAWQAIYGSTNLNTGNWVHVAVVKNGNTSYLYINGASETSGTISRSPSLSYFEIGTLWEHGGIQNRYFPGLIDEIRIWNTARTQAELQSNMNKPLTGSETGLTNYYKMTNGSGTTLSDNKGSSNGTINGATWQTPGVPLLPVCLYVGSTYKTCYSTLKGAFDAINAGTYTGAITLKINESITETSAAVLNNSGTGSANYTSVNIYPTVSGVSISGGLTTPLIDLNGADNVIIDGRVNATGSTKDMVINNTSNSSTSGTSTLRLYNGANNNTIKYCTIKGSSTDGSGGIIFLSATAASTGNTIDNNNITNSSDANRPINAVYSGGAANTVTISNNYIYDFMSRVSTTYGINLNTSTAASTISGNSFYETNTFSPTANRASYYFIYINSTAAGFTVSGNYMGGSAPLCSGTWTKTNSAYSNLNALCLNSVGTGTPSIVKGNTINGFNWSNNNNDAAWSFGITLNAGDVTLGASGEPNTVGSITGTPNMSFTYETNGNIFVPICLNGSGYITCQYNNIGGITCSNVNSNQVTRLHCIYRGNNNANAIISNNTIGSSTNPITLTSHATGDIQYMTGIYNNSGASTGLTISNNTISYLSNQATGSSGYVCGIISYDMPAVLIISNNTVHNLTISNTNEGSGRDACMRGMFTTGTLLTITNNTLYNLTNTNSTFRGYIYGIYATGAGGDGVTNDCSGNTVYNISSTGTGSGPYIYGIFFNGGNYSNNTLNRNYVYDLTSAGVNTNCGNTRYYGIHCPGGTYIKITYANNIISLGGNTRSTIYGIYGKGTNGYSSYSNAYFNTIYLSGSPTEGGLSSYALFNEGNEPKTYKNNVVYNARSNNGTSGNHFCIYYGNTTAVSDYNDLYAQGTGGYIGFYNNNYCTTLPAWRTATSTEANSLNIDPLFVSGFKTAATLNGIDGTGITTDFEGTSRGNPPRMGAYEAAGVITYTWTGATSTAYNVSTNWELNIVPPDGTEFSFAASPVNHCLLDQNRTLGNVTNASGKDLSANGYQLTLSGTTSFTSTGTIDASGTGSTVIYSGSSAQSFASGLFKNNTVYNLTLNNSSGLSQNGALTVSNSLTLTNGSYMIGANTLTLNGSIAYSSGTLTGGSSSNIAFGGSGASTNLAAITLNNLTINRSNGITLSGDVTINNTLTLSSGLLNTSTNTLNFSTSATDPTETSGSRIVGTARIQNVTVGTGAFDFLGFKMYSGSDNLGNVTLVRKTGTAGVVTIGSNSSIASNWDVTVANQPVNGRNIEYKWLSDLDNGKCFGCSNKGVNYFSTNSGVNWVELGTHIDVSTSNPRVMSLTTTHFSQWVSTGENSPLPVSLSSFTSNVNGRDVRLKWVTTAEINNSGFEVQRAEMKNGTQEYIKAGFVNGKGTTNEQTTYTFDDRKLVSGKFVYRLKQIDNNGNIEYFNMNGVVETEIPLKFELSQNYPNPFNPVTKIDFALPSDSKARIVVYDITGREIKTIVNEFRNAGYYTVTFDASLLSSGLYIYRLEANSNGKDFSSTKKMIILK